MSPSINSLEIDAVKRLRLDRKNEKAKERRLKKSTSGGISFELLSAETLTVPQNESNHSLMEKNFNVPLESCHKHPHPQIVQSIQQVLPCLNCGPFGNPSTQRMRHKRSQVRLQEMADEHKAGFVQFYFFPNGERTSYGIKAFGEWGEFFRDMPAMKLAIKEFESNAKALQNERNRGKLKLSKLTKQTTHAEHTSAILHVQGDQGIMVSSKNTRSDRETINSLTGDEIEVSTNDGSEDQEYIIIFESDATSIFMPTVSSECDTVSAVIEDVIGNSSIEMNDVEDYAQDYNRNKSVKRFTPPPSDHSGYVRSYCPPIE